MNIFGAHEKPDAVVTQLFVNIENVALDVIRETKHCVGNQRMTILSRERRVINCSINIFGTFND